MAERTRDIRDARAGPGLDFNARAWLVLAAATLVALVLFVFGVRLIDRIHGIEHRWGRYVDSEMRYDQAIHSLYRALGYGGFIHDFKDYILRREASLLPGIEASRHAIEEAFATFESLTLDPRERAAVGQVRGVLDQHFAKLEFATGPQGRALSPRELDRIARVDDRPALEALAALEGLGHRRHLAGRADMGRVVGEAAGLVRWGIPLLPAVLLTGLGFVSFMRRLVRANEGMRNARNIMDQLLESAPDATLTVSANGRIVRVNARAEALFGYRREELLGLRVEELMPERFRVAHRASREAFFATPGRRRPHIDSGVFTALRRDGAELPVEIGFGRVKRTTGDLVIATVRDISQRLTAEEAVRRSAENFRNLFDNAADGIAIHDLEGRRFMELNRVLCERLGYRPEQLLAMTPEQIDTPESATQVPERLKRLREQGQVLFETVHRTREGRPIPTEVSSRLIQYDGAPAVLSIARDIRERKRAQAALEEEERRLREITAAMGEGLYVMNMEGRISFVNPVACELLGRHAGELLGGDAHALFHHHRENGSPHAAEQCAILLSMQRGQILHKREDTFARADGSLFPVAVVSSPIYRDATLTGAVVVFHDITEQRRQARELILAKEAAEAANRAKSEFLANMSHEIRTPLNAVIGLTQLTLGTALERRQQDYLYKIESASHALLGILNDILDLSKIEAGRMELERTGFRLDQVLERVAILFDAKTREKGLRLTFHPAAAAPRWLRGDPTRLSQVLSNLVSNAVKFTEKGGIEVSVVPLEQGDDSVLLRFQVRDTGIGIAPQHLPALFDAFAQADGSITRRFGGTGLGLTISRRLAHLMGGELTVQSTPGDGSTFCFTARFGVSEEGDGGLAVGDGIGTPEQAQLPALLQRLAGARVLVVDDDAINRQVAAELLEQAGLRAGQAVDGRNALERLEQEPFDAVLMDLQMPVMDGLEATRGLRSDPRWAELPVIGLTAAAMPQDRERCLAAGMNDHVPKPLDLRRLIGTLARWVTPAGRDTPPPRPTVPAAPPTAMPVPADGFDLQAASRRMGGDIGLLQRLMTRFREQHGDTAHRIQAALEAGEREQARRLAHSVKGLAGAMGALGLEQSAARLEQVLASADSAPEPALGAFSARLQQACDTLEQIPAVPPPATAAKSGGESLSALLLRLRRALEANELVEEGLIAGLRESPGAADVQQTLDGLEGSIERFDYAQALGLVEKIESVTGRTREDPND